MKKIIASTITFILGASVVAIGAYITPEQQANIVTLDFEKESIERTTTVTVANLKESAYFTTTTNWKGNTVKTDINIPIKYNFPVASTTAVAYDVIEQNEVISVSLDGYKDCRRGVFGTSTRPFCIQFLKDQIDGNILAHNQGVLGRLKALQKDEFTIDFTNDDL